MLERLRIVLVRPGGATNLGSVCRAMANMGLSDLVLVSPACSPMDEQAVNYASHGRTLLTTARIVADIPAALDGCVLTFATSSKAGLYRENAAVEPAAAARLARTAAESGRVAFAFGPEDRGLLTRELLHFDRVLTIPAHPGYPVLNLAAAVMVVCYELFRASRDEAAPTTASVPVASEFAASPAPATPREWATDGQKQVLYTQLFDALERIGFFRGQQNPDHLRHALRQLLGRAELSGNEADILIGLARQIQWYVRRERK